MTSPAIGSRRSHDTYLARDTASWWRGWSSSHARPVWPWSRRSTSVVAKSPGSSSARRRRRRKRPARRPQGREERAASRMSSTLVDDQTVRVPWPRERAARRPVRRVHVLPSRSRVAATPRRGARRRQGRLRRGRRALERALRPPADVLDGRACVPETDFFLWKITEQYEDLGELGAELNAGPLAGWLSNT